MFQSNIYIYIYIYTGTTQGCCVQFLTISASSILQRSCCTATYFSSHKPSNKAYQDTSLTEKEICNIIAEGFRFIYLAFRFS